MRVNTKKTFCPNCQKLVIGSDKTSDDTIDVSCPRCNEVIWHWNGINWHQVRK
jgi:phage FluMu protein Com